MSTRLFYEGHLTALQAGDRVLLDRKAHNIVLCRRGQNLKIGDRKGAVEGEEIPFKPFALPDTEMVLAVVRQTRGWSDRFRLQRTPYTEGEETFSCFDIVLNDRSPLVSSSSNS